MGGDSLKHFIPALSFSCCRAALSKVLFDDSDQFSGPAVPNGGLDLVALVLGAASVLTNLHFGRLPYVYPGLPTQMGGVDKGMVALPVFSRRRNGLVV